MKTIQSVFTLVITAFISLYLLSCVTSSTSQSSKERSSGSLSSITTIHTAIPSSAKISEKDVKEAILNITSRYGWTLDQEQANSFVFKIIRRKHMVKIKISYSVSEYTIEYVDSENMKYDKETNSIHHNYTRWVNNLDKHIYKSIIHMIYYIINNIAYIF